MTLWLIGLMFTYGFSMKEMCTMSVPMVICFLVLMTFTWPIFLGFCVDKLLLERGEK